MPPRSTIHQKRSQFPCVVSVNTLSSELVFPSVAETLGCDNARPVALKVNADPIQARAGGSKTQVTQLATWLDRWSEIATSETENTLKPEFVRFFFFFIHKMCTSCFKSCRALVPLWTQDQVMRQTEVLIWHLEALKQKSLDSWADYKVHWHIAWFSCTTVHLDGSSVGQGHSQNLWMATGRCCTFGWIVAAATTEVRFHLWPFQCRLNA